MSKKDKVLGICYQVTSLSVRSCPGVHVHVFWPVFDEFHSYYKLVIMVINISIRSCFGKLCFIIAQKIFKRLYLPSTAYIWASVTLLSVPTLWFLYSSSVAWYTYSLPWASFLIENVVLFIARRFSLPLLQRKKHYIKPYFVLQSTWCIDVHGNTTVQFFKFIFLQGRCVFYAPKSLAFHFHGNSLKYPIGFLELFIFYNVNVNVQFFLVRPRQAKS